MADTDLKQYLEILFSNIARELSSFREEFRRETATLSSDIAKQGATIHAIEMQLTQKTGKLEGELDIVFERIREIQEDILNKESVRQQSDISLGTRMANFETAQNEKWKSVELTQKEQLLENERNQTTRRALLWLGGILGLQILLLLWSIFVNGGLSNL